MKILLAPLLSISSSSSSGFWDYSLSRGLQHFVSSEFWNWRYLHSSCVVSLQSSPCFFFKDPRLRPSSLTFSQSIGLWRWSPAPNGQAIAHVQPKVISALICNSNIIPTIFKLAYGALILLLLFRVFNFRLFNLSFTVMIDGTSVFLSVCHGMPAYQSKHLVAAPPGPHKLAAPPVWALWGRLGELQECVDHTS